MTRQKNGPAPEQSAHARAVIDKAARDVAEAVSTKNPIVAAIIEKAVAEATAAAARDAAPELTAVAIGDRLINRKTGALLVAISPSFGPRPLGCFACQPFTEPSIDGWMRSAFRVDHYFLKDVCAASEVSA